MVITLGMVVKIAQEIQARLGGSKERCKKEALQALIEAEGDMEKARDILRDRNN